MNCRVDTASANKDLAEQIVVVKTEIALLQRKKRLLLEELHRQYLDGEIEPKKRMKMVGRVEVPQEAFIAALSTSDTTSKK